MNNEILPTTSSKLPTILVTGGAGYIGSFTVKELLSQGYNVVVLDSLENGHKEAIDPRAILEISDLADSNAIAKIFDKYHPAAVIDFAAYLAVGESMENPKKYMENNVANFIKLLDVMVCKDCKYVIKSSTASTYGDPLKEEDFPLKENYQEHFTPEKSELLEGKWDDSAVIGEEFFQKFISYYEERFGDRLNLSLNNTDLTKLRIPTSIYGLTKLLDEILMEKYSEKSVSSHCPQPLLGQEGGLKYVALRYFNVCGGAKDGQMGDDKPVPTNLMTLTILSALGKSGPLKVFGNDYPTKDGTGVRDYIHPLDLATGHAAALKYLLEGNNSEIFNLGKGEGYSVLEVINSIEKASGKKIQYEFLPRRSGDVITSIADPGKAKEKLGWEAKYNLEDMAESAWKWQNQHPGGYNEIPRSKEQ